MAIKLEIRGPDYRKAYRVITYQGKEPEDWELDPYNSFFMDKKELEELYELIKKELGR